MSASIRLLPSARSTPPARVWFSIALSLLGLAAGCGTSSDALKELLRNEARKAVDEPRDTSGRLESVSFAANSSSVADLLESTCAFVGSWTMQVAHVASSCTVSVLLDDIPLMNAIDILCTRCDYIASYNGAGWAVNPLPEPLTPQLTRELLAMLRELPGRRASSLSVALELTSLARTNIRRKDVLGHSPDEPPTHEK